MASLLRGVARVRHELARRPWIHRVVVVAAAVLAAWSAVSWSARVDAERQRWGASATVLVAHDDVPAGAPIAGRVREAAVPLAMVPAAPVKPDALRTEPGLAARHGIGAGEIVSVHDVVPDPSAGRLAPAGSLVVPVTEQVTSPAGVGDDVVVAVDGVVLGRGRVVGRDQGVVLLAVDPTDAAAVAHAGASGVSLLVPAG